MKPDISLFWAKTTHDAETCENAFHPLICHLIDVGAATQALWENALPEITRRKLARPFGLENDLSKAGNLIAFLVGLHDLGKCAPPFALRGQDELRNKNSLNESLKRHSRKSSYGKKVWGKLQTIELLTLYRNTDFDCQILKSASDAPHNFVTAVILPPILRDKFGFPEKLAKNVAEIIGGHHGTFPDSNYLNNCKSNAFCGDEHWREAQAELSENLAELFGIKGISLDLTDEKLDNATAMIFAGLTTVADWIGSNTDFFQSKIEDWREVLNKDFKWFELEDYFNESKQKAAEALETLGWTNWIKESHEKSFDELFSDLKNRHRHLQDVAVEIANEPDFNSVGIAVVESPMGEGKTEAAMFLADAWNAKLGTRGIYFALPTQATSNQMFGRVKEFLRGRFSDKSDEFVHLLLQHGHSSISAEFAENIRDFRNIQNISDDAEDKKSLSDFSNVVAAEWFTYKKRGLLVPFGVGTIDQILLAVLQTKHVFVRLFGLAHKTVIIDEVHAYDAYMSTLLERLLEWLAALGSPVVILSATLPQKKRDALIKAYLKGLGKAALADQLTEIGADKTYPRISYATAAMPDKTFKVRHLNTSAQNTKTLHLEWKDENNFIDELKAKLENGGCAAIICNTVDKAQKLYHDLSNDKLFAGLANDDLPKLDLLHARFRFKDREQREQRALIRFGKKDGTVRVARNGETIEKPVKRPDCAVLISTQIIEQSLDLDFDLMISELAPADLLLQRAGRLQRHKRDRLDPFKEKTALWLIKPPTDASGDLIIKDKLPDFGASGLIYDKHILLRSWLRLKDETDNEIKIEIPADIENLIEDVYDEERVFEKLPENVLQLWRETLKTYRYNRKLDKNEAQVRYVSSPHYDDHLGNFIKTPKEEDAPELHPAHQAQTRLIEPTANVVCLWEKDGKFYTDETYGETVLLDEKPSNETAKTLLFNSLTVSSKSVVFKLLAEKVPDGWEKSALLMRHRALKFGANRKCEMFGYEFHLDENLGLRITKIE
ncbi:MAG TPA: CRISPR-associated helicase Cas3' [Pyrinomonadaceae bacterium]|nr:CRISPR-associated helicase Cas3' [Pyrinomonadaceae bacterium]